MGRRRERVIERASISITFKNCLYAIKEVWKFDKKYCILVIIVQLFTQSISVFQASYYMKYLVQSIENHSDFSKIVYLVVGYFVMLLILGLVSSLVFIYYQDLVWNKFKQYFNKILFKKSGNVELSCYENPEFYNKYTMALDNTSERIMQVNSNAYSVVFSIYRVTMLFVSMIAVDYRVIFFLIFPLLGNFLFAKRDNIEEQKIYKENAKNNRIIEYVKRTLHLQQFSKEMRLTNIYQLIQKKHMQAVKDYCDVNDKHSKKKCLFFWSSNLFTYTFLFEGVLLFCAYQSMVKGTISLAQMTVMTSMMVATASGITNLFDSLMSIHNEGLYIQNARDFMAYNEKIPEDFEGEEVPNKIETIEFKNVSFGYKPDKYNVENVSFKIDAGKSVAFVGQNGAGKSTIVKLLFRLYDVNEGEILLNGKNIKRYNIKAYRELFAAAFQDYKVIAMSVKDNITMGANISDDEAIKDILKKVELYDKIDSFENGIDTILTKEFDFKGEVLSGGQYQKLAVARAVAQDRPVMVFDEPSSALDPIAEYNLFKTIMQESKNKTMVLISHRLSSVKNADLVFMFENGKLIEQGTHKQLIEKHKKYEKMYSYQAYNYLAREVK